MPRHDRAGSDRLESPGLLRPRPRRRRAGIRAIDARIRAVEQQLEAAAAQALSVHQLLTIPGTGLLTVTALVAAVGDVQRFPCARHVASYLGLTPRETSLRALSRQDADGAAVRPAACLGGPAR